jgi:hypothetical protein
MGKISTLLIMGCLMAMPSTQTFAQAADPGLSEARIRLACGTGRVVGAETLPDGSIRVTCSQQTGLPAELAGTGLTPEVAAAIATTVVILGVVISDGSDNTTTTTTNVSGP